MNDGLLFHHGLISIWILFFTYPASIMADSYEPGFVNTSSITSQHWERLGGKIPDVSVSDQHGRIQRFYTDLVKGKTVAINFVYTTCTSVCPVLTEIFRSTLEMLDARGGETKLISISVDPSNDTLPRLKEFALRYHAGTDWSFITADKTGIDLLLKSLGAFSSKRDDHSTMVLIGNDANDRWVRSYGMTPAVTLVQMLDEVRIHHQAVQNSK